MQNLEQKFPVTDYLQQSCVHEKETIYSLRVSIGYNESKKLAFEAIIPMKDGFLSYYGGKRFWLIYIVFPVSLSLSMLIIFHVIMAILCKCAALVDEEESKIEDASESESSTKSNISIFFFFSQ